MATPIGPPELKIATRSPRLLLEATWESPRPTDAGCIELTNPWTRVDPIKNHLATRPKFSQSVSLDFPDCRELVIVPLQKGRLRVPDQKHAAHASPGFRDIGTSHDRPSVTPVILPIL